MINTSKIIIGCMSWGNWGKKLSLIQQTEMIEFCLENKLSTFDHADIYGDYTTEFDFGKAFKNSIVKREDIQLISKCGIQYVGNTRKNLIKHYNYSKDYIIWSAEESLKNLQTDYLDVFLLHRPSPLMQPDEIAEAITQLQNSGKIKHFGVSNFASSQLALISNKVKVSVNQIEFSLTEPTAMYNGNLDYMLQHGISAMSWSPLGKVYKEENTQTIRIKKALQILSEKYNTTEDVLLISWILKHPANIIPVIGTTNKQRIMKAKAALQLSLELEDWFMLLTESQGFKVP